MAQVKLAAEISATDFGMGVFELALDRPCYRDGARWLGCCRFVKVIRMLTAVPRYGAGSGGVMVVFPWVVEGISGDTLAAGSQPVRLLQPASMSQLCD